MAMAGFFFNLNLQNMALKKAFQLLLSFYKDYSFVLILIPAVYKERVVVIYSTLTATTKLL